MNRYKLICLYIHLFICIFNLNAQSVIQMKKEQGVFTVPCKVNGLPLKFILDTGASDVSLSLKEADYILKNGLLNDEDIIGSDYYQNATGSISVGVRVILREIIFGDIKIYGKVHGFIYINGEKYIVFIVQHEEGLKYMPIADQIQLLLHTKLYECNKVIYILKIVNYIINSSV